MASKDLKVNVIVNAKTKELDKMFKRLNKMQTKLNQQATAQNTITRAVQKTNAAHKKSGSLIDGLTKKVHRLANAYLGVMGAKAAITTSDAITKAENKLNHLNATALGSAGYTTNSSGEEVYSQATLNATQQSMDKMYTSAQKVRMVYTDMMTNVSKSMTLAGDAFGGNIDNAIRFQEIMSEAYTLSGASAAEKSSSMYQLIQGLGSGVLQGDELRSVREGASLAYKAIEEFAQGIYGADKNLKDLAADGLITSDIVVKAILNNGEKMDKAFAKTKLTFEDAWTNIKNTAVKSFEPVLQKLNELLNSPVGKAIVNGIGKAIQIVANAALWLFGIIENGYNFIVNNWDAVRTVLLALSTILGTLLLIQVGQLISGLYKLLVTAGMTAAGWLVAWWPLLLLVGLLILLVIKWAETTQTICDFIYQVCIALAYGIIMVLTLVLIAYLATGAIMLSIPVLIALIVIAVIALIIAIFVKFTGEVVGGVLGTWEVIKAVVSWILTGWRNMCNNLSAWFWNSIADMLDSVDWLLEGINKIREALGKDPIDVGSIRAKAESYESKVVENKLDIGSAWNTGYNKGYAIGENIQSKINNFGENFKGVLNGNGLDELLGLTPLPTDGISPNLDEIAGNTDGIDKNTGKMADSMELTAEDLAYLKDVANREWKKEFTTASITVDMTNNNTVDKDFDLNSLAIGLRNLVEEEMYAVANGVYA